MEEVNYAITLSIKDMHKIQKDFQEIIINQNSHHSPSDSLLKLFNNVNSLIMWTENGEISTTLDSLKGVQYSES